MREALTPTGNRYTRRWRPHLKQAAFMLLGHEEVLFGGAAGPGKSFALILAALQYAHVPGYSAVLFRRTYPQLAGEGGLIPKAHAILAGTDAVWNQQERVYRFPSGATLAFRHLQYEHTKYDHDGLEYQFIGFDELTHFTQGQYLFLFSRLRRSKAIPVPLRARSTTNPGGPGHAWVKARFVDPDTRLPQCAYLPATLDDNPSLDREAYRRQLAKLDPVERAQKLRGDWDVVADGVLFGDHHFKRYDTPPEALAEDPGAYVITSWDLKNVHDTREIARKGESWAVGQVWAFKGSRGYLIEEVRGLWSADDSIPQIERMAKRYPRARQHLIEAKAAGPYVIKRLKETLPGVLGINPVGSKAQRADGILPFCRAGDVWVPNEVVHPWVKDTLHEIKQYPSVPNDRGDALIQAVEHGLGGYTPPIEEDTTDIDMDTIRATRFDGDW